jgi:small subunit ribosomal protein S8
MMTDTIADMLTRIRNASAIERPMVKMPATKVKVAIAKVLKEEGFIIDYQVGKTRTDDEGNETFDQNVTLAEAKVDLVVYLKYGPDGEKVIRHIARYSKPGGRVYKQTTDLKRVLDGLGISIISTSSGVMSDRQARKAKVGGEILCTVW